MNREKRAWTTFPVELMKRVDEYGEKLGFEAAIRSKTIRKIVTEFFIRELDIDDTVLTKAEEKQIDKITEEVRKMLIETKKGNKWDA